MYLHRVRTVAFWTAEILFFALIIYLRLFTSDQAGWSTEGFLRVGIGVLDGGIYGKMFVQEFTD